MSKLAVVIVAAGQSQRFGNPIVKKPFASIHGKAVWLYSAEFFLKRDDVGQVVVVVAPDDHESFLSQYAANLAVWGFDVVTGGSARADSVANGVRHVRSEFPLVSIHDAARPCLSDDLINRIFNAAAKHQNVIPAVHVTSTVKRSVDGKTVESTLDREPLYLAQDASGVRSSGTIGRLRTRQIARLHRRIAVDGACRSPRASR